MATALSDESPLMILGAEQAQQALLPSHAVPLRDIGKDRRQRADFQRCMSRDGQMMFRGTVERQAEVAAGLPGDPVAQPRQGIASSGPLR